MASCKQGESDSGKLAIGSVLTALALGVAGYNTAAALSTAQQQYSIAKRYLDIAQWWRDYYNSVYVSPENIELEEVKAIEEEEPEEDMAIGRARTIARLQFKGLAYQNIRCTSEYCTGLRSALLKDAALGEAAAVAAAGNLGYQNELAWIEARNDLRWKKILSVINRGRDMIADNVRFSQLAFGIFGDLTKQSAAAAGGAMNFFGYALNRNETNYPVLASQRVTRPYEAAQPTAAATPTQPEVTSRSGTKVTPNGNVPWSESDNLA